MLLDEGKFTAVKPTSVIEENYDDIIGTADERKAIRRKDYYKFAGLEENAQLDAENMDDWALNRVSRIHNMDKDRLKEELTEGLLTEDEDDTFEYRTKKQPEATQNTTTIANAVAKEIEAEKVVAPKSKGQIETVLDSALDRALDIQELGRRGDYPNILFIGEAGTGKTSIIRQWAKDNNINLFEVRAAGMDDTDLGGAIAPDKETGTVRRFSSSEFDVLNRPNSVLFLDEYNRAPKSVRTNLLELVNSHVVPDSREEDGQRFLPNFLFTIAAINPANANYDTDVMDMAERTRFRNIDVIPEPKTLLKHLEATYQEQADKLSRPTSKKAALGKKALAQALLGSKDFQFDSSEDIEKTQQEGNGLALNYRTFKNALDNSDGTKEGFLKIWNEYTNNLKLPMVKRILANYKDVDDKANDALKQGTESPVFQKKLSVFDQLSQNIDN